MKKSTFETDGENSKNTLSQYCKAQKSNRKLMTMDGILRLALLVCVALALLVISLINGKVTPVSAESADKTFAPDASLTAPLNNRNRFSFKVSKPNTLISPNLRVSGNIPQGINVALVNVDTPINFTGMAPAAFIGSFDAGDMTHNRPVTCATLSGVGTAVSYDTVTITNNSPATANFVTSSSLVGGGACGDNNDTVFTLYNTSFNPAAPLTNCLVINDDIAAAANRCSSLSFAIPVGQTRVVTVAGFNNVALPTGQFSYQINFTGTVVNAAGVSVGGRVMTSDRRGLRDATVTLTMANGETLQTRASSFGYFNFDDVEAGQNVIVQVTSKDHQFPPQVVFLEDNITDLEFTPLQ